MMTRYLSSSILLAAIAVTGCGAASELDVGGSAGSTTSTTTTGSSGSTGTSGWTFTNCASGFDGPNSNLFLNENGFVAGATLTVTEEANGVGITYVEPGRASDSLLFAATCESSAENYTITGTVTGPAADCIAGPSEKALTPSTMTIEGGVLAYDVGTVFLSLAGTAEGTAGAAPCGMTFAPERRWVVCSDGQVGPLGVADSSSVLLLAGTYQCTSQIATYYATGGTTENVAGGGTGGTLTVTTSPPSATAVYTGDSSLAGTLDFTAVQATVAYALPGQTLLTPCDTSLSSPGPAETLTIEAAAFVNLDDEDFFLSIRGTMAASSSCPGAVKMGAVMCTAH